ncbi:MAG: hypothetical protein ABN479_03645 [Billgrantia sp.]
MALSVLLRMQDQMTAPVKRAQESLGAFKRNAESIGRQVGFERVTENFSRAGEAGRELYDTAGRVGRRLAAVSAAGAAALTGITVAVANSADELAKFADQMDIPVESLQEWQYAAERMGVSQSTFNSSLAAFSRRLADARDGTGALHSRLKETNPELLEQLTHARDTNEALSLYMRAMEGAADQTERNGMAAAAFSRAGMDMSRMVRDGADEIDRLRERARDLGFILSDETARQSEQFADQMLDMRKSMLGLRNIIGGALMPAFGDLMDQITAGVLYVQPLVREWAEGFAADLPGRIAWLRGEFDALMVTINPALELGAALVERFGALHVAAGALALMIGAPLIVPLVKFTAAVVSLGWALGRVGFALVGLAVKALPAVLAGLKTLALAAMAHPVLATVALLAGGAALLIANWDRVGPFFRDTWAWVSDATRRGWEAVTEWLGFDPLAMLEPLWRPIGDWLGRQLDAWKRLLSGEWGAVKEIFRWSPLGLLVSGFGRAREWLAGLTWRDAAEGGWSALKALYRWSPLGVMQRGFGRALEYLGGVDWPAAAEAGWSALKALYRWSPLGLLQRGFGGALAWLRDHWDALTAEAGWAWDVLKGILAWSPLATIEAAWGGVADWFSGMWDGITERAERAIGWIADRLEWVGNTFSRAAGALGISRNDEPPPAVAGPGAPTRMPRRDADQGDAPPPAEPHPLARSREMLGGEPAPAAQDEAPAWVREWQRQRGAEAAPGPEAAEPLAMARRGAPEHERRQGGGTTVQRVDFRPQITIEAGANANAEDLANLLDERLARYRDETMWEQVQGVEAD